MHKNILAIALASAIAPLLPNTANAQQQVSENHRQTMYSKPSVVRILTGCSGTLDLKGIEDINVKPVVGFGSGFFITSDGYISTNAHVVELVREQDKCKHVLRSLYKEKLEAMGNQLDPEEQKKLADLIQQLPQAEFKNFQPINQVLTPGGKFFPFEIKSYGAPVGEGKDVAIIKIEIENAPVLKLADSKEVQLQDRITVIGYPSAGDDLSIRFASDFQASILNIDSILEASFTDGTISAKKNLPDGAPVLQVSAPATRGNSGGPVINDKGEVIGMLTFGIPVQGQEIPGFNFVVPANTIMEFVRQAGTTNQEGLIEEQYRQGLNHYWQGEYQAAIAKFEEVKRLFPQHSEVERLMQESQQAIAQGREKTSTTTATTTALNSPSSPPSPTVSPTPNAPSSEQPRVTHWFGGGISPWLSILLTGGMGVAIGAVYLTSLNKKLQPAARKTPRTQPPIAFEHNDPTQAIATTKLGTITCITGALAGQKWEISAAGLYIGRDRSLCQVAIDDSRISKRQVWIGQRANRMVALDLGSSNGTFLNRTDSQKITEVFLNRGDTLILGDASVAQFLYSPPPPLSGSDRTMTEADRTSIDTPTRCGGTLTCISGALAGQQFDIPPQGLYIGRDSKLAGIAIDDRRVSKQHVWIGMRGDRVVAIDRGSSNGTFVNVPGSERIGEIALNSGDTIILCETDVARFQYDR